MEQLPQVEHGGDRAALIAAEVDQQVATAKRYPRDVAECRAELVALATMDLDTAEACTYSLPRDGRAITGPSVRLAEMAVSAWGNIRAGWRVTDIADRWVECEGAAHDLQKNVSVSVSAKRSIVSNKGSRYSENMVQVTAMACGAIAYRNAVFKVIPASLIKTVLDATHKLLIESVGDYRDKLPELVKAMSSVGVEQRRLCRYFNIDEIDEISPVQYVACRGIYRAINAGEAVAGDYFGRAREATTGTSLEDLEKGPADES